MLKFVLWYGFNGFYKASFKKNSSYNLIIIVKNMLKRIVSQSYAWFDSNNDLKEYKKIYLE